MKAIPKRQANDAVYEEILENIKNGVWKKGDKLPSEQELCNILQVSRSTVRTALQRLKALGLIEVKHGKGSYVSDTRDIFQFDAISTQVNLTQKEFADMTGLREAIEPKAIELALKNQNKEALEEMNSAYENMIKAAKNADLEEYSREDCAFHLSILLASGNAFFTQIANIFKDQYFHYFQELNKFMLKQVDGKRMISFKPEDPEDPHTKIFNALNNPDIISATEAIEEILAANQMRYHENILKRENEK